MLLGFDDLHSFADLDTFSQNIPVEWVESALQLTAKASIRRRRLPPEQVLWLVVGMAMFRHEPIGEVVRRLNICADGLANEALLARSGLSEARQRLGDQSLEWLFKRTGQHWGAERYPQDDWHGLQVFAVDGALFRTPDTPELREHFGSGNTSSQRQTAFPMMRLVALMNVRSHVILNAQLSPYRRSEMRLAETFTAQIPDHSVTLFDKGFWGADLLLTINRTGDQRHWLIPERRGLVYEEVEAYSEHDRLLRMKVSAQARKRNPELPETWNVRAVSYEVNGKLKTVFTSLPAKQFSTAQVAALYQERWEIELGFRDIKSSMQHNAITLRSKKVELIYQEVWGMLLAYNVIRREASQAAVSYGRSPCDIRFKPACQFIAAQLIVMAAAQPASRTGARLSELRAGVASLFLDDRPRQSTPRTVKISKTRYPVDRKAAPLK
ncbi:IS4 family transposase [Marinobacterium jannaschii]|uniref:IS4 family transposase n=1 Tax=Marinobacterium jannaschii TaxID=64970 RepID=UPI000483805B|nr:IS4 family transposase [Marinobacterium jannaschii]